MPKGYDSSTKQTFKWAEVEQIQKEAFRSILYFGYCEDCIYFIVTPPDRKLIKQIYFLSGKINLSPFPFVNFNIINIQYRPLAGVIRIIHDSDTCLRR